MNEANLNTEELTTIRTAINNAIDFNLNVIRLILSNQNIDISIAARDKIIDYYLFNNVDLKSHLPFKELESVLEEAARICTQNVIQIMNLRLEKKNIEYLPIPTGLKLEDLERKYILQTLYFSQQNRTRTADTLGISIRTLRNKINQYKMEGYL